LAKPGVLEKYLNANVVEAVRDVFTGIFPLDEGSEGDAAIQLALQNPDRYVLKPQREGGGHNFYGQNVKTKLLGRYLRNMWNILHSPAQPR